MDQKINTLKNLITSYTRPEYYVIMQIPRSIPDGRVLAYPSGITSTTKVDGLEAYYNKSIGKAAVQETFDQAVLNWSYIYYSIKDGNAQPSDAYVRNFFSDFYTKY